MMIILDIEFATLAVIIMAWLTIAVLSLKGIGYLADALWRAASTKAQRKRCSTHASIELEK